MWNLLGYYEHPTRKELTPVTIIASYFNSDNKLTYLIAVDEQGKFYSDPISRFTSQNKLGTLT